MRLNVFILPLTLAFLLPCLAHSDLLRGANGGFYASLPDMPSKLENFRLLDQHGYSQEFYRQADAKAVVLMGYFVGCPGIKGQAVTLKQNMDSFSGKGVSYLMLDPRVEDTPEAISKDLAELGLEIPVLRDVSQSVSKSMGISATCQAIICTPGEGWAVAWRGDLGGLENALTSLINGEAPVVNSAETTASSGSPIPYLDAFSVSYLGDVAPILQEKCASCHTKDGVGPFPMSSHKKVQGWAEMMRETIRTGTMPPWHADPHYGEFANSRGLDAEEERILLAWLDAGAPWDGAGTDPLQVAYEQAKTDDWVLGEPDMTLQLPFEQTIKKSGVEDYRYLTVETKLTEDKWVRAIEVKPTNRMVVHHVLIFVKFPPEYEHIEPRAQSGLGGFYAAYLPGSIIKPFPEGYAQFLPRGSSFIFQMHYNTTGKDEVDQTKMALYFDDGPPKMSVNIRAASETDFSISPNDPDSETYADYKIRKDAVLLAMAPHMHFRGGRMKFTAEYPDGGEKVLMSVPKFVFDWQPMYTLKKPIPLPAGTRILCEGAFDNSKFNPQNPNPNQWVHFGEQSFEEMFIGYVQFAVPYDPADFSPQEVENKTEGEEPLHAENLVGTKWNLYRFILEFKADGELLINGYYKGKWSIKDENNIYVESSFRNLYLAIVNNRLNFMGRELRREY